MDIITEIDNDKCVDRIISLIEENDKNDSVEFFFEITPDETYWEEHLETINSELKDTIESLLKVSKMRKEQFIEKLLILKKYPNICSHNKHWKEYYECSVYSKQITFAFNLELNQILIRRNSILDRILKIGINTTKYWEYEMEDNLWNIKKRFG